MAKKKNLGSLITFFPSESNVEYLHKKMNTLGIKKSEAIRKSIKIAENVETGSPEDMEEKIRKKQEKKKDLEDEIKTIESETELKKQLAVIEVEKEQRGKIMELKRQISRVKQSISLFQTTKKEMKKPREKKNQQNDPELIKHLPPGLLKRRNYPLKKNMEYISNSHFQKAKEASFNEIKSRKELAYFLHYAKLAEEQGYLTFGDIGGGEINVEIIEEDWLNKIKETL